MRTRPLVNVTKKWDSITYWTDKIRLALKKFLIFFNHFIPMLKNIKNGTYFFIDQLLLCTEWHNDTRLKYSHEKCTIEHIAKWTFLFIILYKAYENRILIGKMLVSFNIKRTKYQAIFLTYNGPIYVYYFMILIFYDWNYYLYS